MLTTNFWISLSCHQVLLATLCWITGRWVLDWGVKVNYTRKINHFALMLFPFAMAAIWPYPTTLATVTTNLVVFVFATLFLSEPVRSRVPMLATAFASIDRPEDRPHTIWWIITQAIGSYAVLIAIFIALQRFDQAKLIVIPLVVNGLGDGLAEPVGVRFGRHRYRVPSLIAGRDYTRSWEGSACVAITALVVVLGLRLAGLMNSPATMALLVTLPVLATAAEAFSPHAWDAPILYAVCGLNTLAVVWLTG